MELPWFYALLALAILILLFVPPAWDWMRGIRHWLRSIAEQRRAKREAAENSSGRGIGCGYGNDCSGSPWFFLRCWSLAWRRFRMVLKRPIPSRSSGRLPIETLV